MSVEQKKVIPIEKNIPADERTKRKKRLGKVHHQFEAGKDDQEKYVNEIEDILGEIVKMANNQELSTRQKADNIIEFGKMLREWARKEEPKAV